MGNLFAITRDDESSKTYRVMLDASSQVELAKLFDEQISDFYDSDTQKITYDGRYKVSGNEVLVIADFALFEHIEELQEAIESPGAHQKFDPSELEDNERLVGLCWSCLNGDEQQLSFQVLNSSHVLKDKRAGLFYLFKEKVLEPLLESGLEIGAKLVAVYEGGELMFKSYYMANRLFGLEEQNYAATQSKWRNC